ncbi:MAG: undecaprenyldiphospho-muramoylpentapeptide beta-N-acetylglucosaminyltransferase [Novosphingobium sp.]|nr:undecaprenyldiphospho-muramoylpentapeptide beta-N-acetylglucosaminyltransferase [Novosphingobium sp.]MBO9601621.1 undecaprenyldiphospho-muramoylpentapeptide beta-N-acetylglucosaminyltransferase [Novosphingobium sp.]
MSGATRHYVLAAGGTGGHLIPAFALASELHRRGHHVALVTDARGAAIPGKPDYLPAHVLPAGRFGKNPLKWPGGIKAVLEGRRMALRLFESFEPSAVVGFGGYPALPALLAATSARIPSVLHEQNAVLGRVNRLLAGRVDAIATAYPEVARLKDKLLDKVHLVGNPVRAEVLALRDEPYPAFTEDGLLRVLVTGGSQGARVLSEVVPDGLAMLQPALRSRLQVTQQCRAEDIDAVRERYASHGIPAELGTYFEDMEIRLADAHLFIGRAGASTIAELTAVGRPAILVPLPIATDDHQAANVREMVKAGGARSIRQPAFTAKELAKQIQAMAQHPETLANAAHAAWNCGRPNAAKDLADLVEGFGGVPLMDVIRVNAGETIVPGDTALARDVAA